MILRVIDPHPVQNRAEASRYGNHGPHRTPALGNRQTPGSQVPAPGSVPQDDARRLA